METKGLQQHFMVDFMKTVGLCVNNNANNNMPSQNYIMNIFFPAVLKRHQDVYKFESFIICLQAITHCTDSSPSAVMFP